MGTTGSHDAIPAAVSEPAGTGPARKPVVIGVDLGGTTIKGAVFDLDGAPERLSTCLSPPEGGTALLGSMLDLISGLQRDAEDRGRAPVGIGVVVPGVVDEASGRVIYAANLGWHDVGLAEAVKGHSGLPTTVGHDVRGASLAERSIGGARERSDFILVMLGTGISCAIHNHGVIRNGYIGAAGELGHVPVLPGGEACRCGQQGCLEVYASAAGIARRYHAAGGDSLATAATVAALSSEDPVAAQVWHQATAALGLALATLTLVIDPGLILIGGGLSRAGATLAAPTAEAVSRHLRWRQPPPITMSPLGPDAGRIGAAILALETLGYAERVRKWTPELTVGALETCPGD